MIQNNFFISYGCDDPNVPILVAAPHAGRDYPAIMDNLRIAPEQLLRLEDRYVDILLRDVMAHNIPTLLARAPRAVIDLNRNTDEIDADMVTGLDWNDVAHPSVKTRGGLGLIPRRLSGAGEIWKNPLSKAQVNERIETIHRPYHSFVAKTLARMVQKFGTAVLIDVHSMPSLSIPMSNGHIAQWVVGDHYGASADNIFSDLIIATLNSKGYHVALNAPYSGGYILQRHGRRQHNQHALQLEIDRGLYLDRDHREPTDQALQISAQIKNLVDVILKYLRQNNQLEAAE